MGLGSGGVVNEALGQSLFFPFFFLFLLFYFLFQV